MKRWLGATVLALAMAGCTPVFADHVCLPPGVEDGEVYKDITRQGMVLTEFGPAWALDFVFRGKPAFAVIAEGEAGRPELVLFDTGPTDLGVPYWKRRSLDGCEWELKYAAGREGA